LEEVVGKLVGIAVLVAAVVGGIVLSSLAGASITSDDSKPSAKAVVTASAPATSCARPRTTAAALVPLQGTPTPTNTPGPTNTPTSTNTPAPTNTPTSTNTPAPTNTPTSTNTPAPTNTPTRTTTPIAPTSTPTAVQVISLSAGRAAKQSVLLRWRTASEASLLGFNVYCGPSKHRVQRNTHLIRAHGSVSRGRLYSFRDRIAARVRRAGPYWLQIVDVQGNRSWYGSVIAR